jgi:phage tail-like protein
MPERNDPHGGFGFLVQIQDVGSASFSEVSGLGVEVEVIEYRDGNEDLTVRKLPGLRKYTNIVLKRGVTADRGLWEWLSAVGRGQPDRRDGAIVLLGESRQPVLRWTFRAAWPRKWVGPTLRADASEVAIETIELCHEGLELDSE